jgi:orotate phosphoribosyltransferase
MSDRDELRQQIIDKAVVHGKVILSSGKEADYYVDLRRVTLDSEAAPIIGRVMLELTKDLDFDAVGGLTLGADPVATAMLARCCRTRSQIRCLRCSQS